MSDAPPTYDHPVRWSAWDEVARAEMTLTVAHGVRELRTRVLLADGRILEQVNPGLPDLEDEWHEIARSADLEATLEELRRDGWSVLPRLRTSSPFA